MKKKAKYKKKVPIICEGSLPKNKADRLRKIRGLANLTRENLASEGSGITLYSVRSWETARFGGLSLDGAQKVIKRVALEGVKCTLEWLLHGLGVAPEGTILEKDKNDETTTQRETRQREIIDNEALLITEELAFFKKQFKRTLDLRVEDDGLSPLYLPGEYVAGIERYKKDFASLIGLNCIVITDQHKTYLRRLQLGTKRNRFTLECINTSTSVETPTLCNVKLLRAAPITRHYMRDPDRKEINRKEVSAVEQSETELEAIITTQSKKRLGGESTSIQNLNLKKISAKGLTEELGKNEMDATMNDSSEEEQSKAKLIYNLDG